MTVVANEIENRDPVRESARVCGERALMNVAVNELENHDPV